MPRDNNEPSVFNMFMNVTNTLTHLTLGAVAISAIIFAIVFPGSNHLIQHIYLCVVGYIIMMAQAILVFSPHSGWSVSLRYQDKKVTHWLMQVVGAILAITGSIIRIANLNNNFQSTHGILGLIAMILTIISLVGGAVNLYTQKTAFTKIIHSCAGTLTLMAAFLCLCFGFNTTIYRITLSDTVANMSIALTVIALVGTLMSACISNANRMLKR